jgi:hypothetical protein
MLRGKSNEELLTIVRTLLDEAGQRGKHIGGLIPYIYEKEGKIPKVSNTKLIELIAEISWKLGEDQRTFNPQKYLKNVFKGKQKGRAYKAFIEH